MEITEATISVVDDDADFRDSPTPPGQIFCSQAFAALAAVELVTDFSCEYVGEVQLAKDAGVHPMYMLRPNTAWG